METPLTVGAVLSLPEKKTTSVNHLIQRERDLASFNSTEITNLLNGGAQKTVRKRQLADLVLSQPAVKKAYREKHTGDESTLFENALRQGLLLADLVNKYNLDQEEEDYIFNELLDNDVAIGLHYFMFIPALINLGTKEQHQKWLGPAKRAEIIGAYVQTELGQGSSLKTLETTAEYDPPRDEFVLNTPYPTGVKWWPGGRRMGNMVLVMAKLVIDGKQHGLQPFMVQIRSFDNHELCPGCEAGGIGDKMSRQVLDNGFLILKNVRIPRENMLMKHNEVTPEGKFVRKSVDKTSYITMVKTRATLVQLSSIWAAKAATIATRYSAIRCQGEMQPGSPPTQIMDYMTQQKKLFPAIAEAYAFKFAERGILKSYDRVAKQLGNGDASELPVIHANSAGLKAYCTDAGAAAIETCRRALGGQGYSLSSGIASLYTEAVGSITYEGENTLMYLQTARHLLKEMTDLLKGKKLIGELSYLNDRPRGPVGIEEIAHRKFTALINAFNARSYYLLNQVATNMLSDIKGGVPHHQAWNTHSVALINAAKAHLEGYIISTFCENVTTLEMSTDARNVLCDLCILYSVSKILQKTGDFLTTNALTVQQVRFLTLHETELLDRIRPEAVALVDAFDFPDGALYTSVGNYDGHVYERLVNEARKNASKNNQVHPAIKQFYLPRRAVAKL